MVRGLHTMRRRRTAAWVVGLLWVLAVEVLPNLHLLAHHRDHTHDTSGAIVEIELHRDAPRHHHDHSHPTAVAHDHGHVAHPTAAQAVAGHGDGNRHHHHAAVDRDGHDAITRPAATIAVHAYVLAQAVADHGDGGPRRHGAVDHDDHDELAPFAPAHAAAGIAHRALALHTPAPPLLAPLPVELASWWIVDAPIAAPHTTQLARPTARGPPATALT
ncbi:MAG: hypothetical protein KIT31_43250 [Deltaproteobacteria bacterium]|nr:hypothetical protein [Deltaproteobacteria bacterium]